MSGWTVDHCDHAVLPPTTHFPSIHPCLQRILKVDYHIPSHIKLSPEGHDLLRRVLVADPAQRMTVKVRAHGQHFSCPCCLIDILLECCCCKTVMGMQEGCIWCKDLSKPDSSHMQQQRLSLDNLLSPLIPMAICPQARVSVVCCLCRTSMTTPGITRTSHLVSRR